MAFRFRVDQLQHAAVLAHDALEQHLRFLSERAPQVVVEIGEQPKIRGHGLQVTEIQPLVGEVGRQRFRTWIREKTLHLGRQHRGVREISARCG